MHGFTEQITQRRIDELKETARLCRGDIIKMTTVAGSGHPGGSMSSIDIYLTLFSHARISREQPHDPGRDRIIVSHGHTSPGLYACLSHLGFIDRSELIPLFRSADSPFEGHIERNVPGVEWTTGNLGQGLAAGCGFALAGRLTGKDFHTFVVMSDGEQAKGQVAEARRFCRKYGLTNLTVIIDRNHIQISGRTEDVMDVKIKDNYLSDGWRVLEVPGHDIREIHEALRKALSDNDHPYAIICETVIGKGVSFMEGNREYHGRALTAEESAKALAELGIENDIDGLREMRRSKRSRTYDYYAAPLPELVTGSPSVYERETHPRAVFGDVLKDIASHNPHAPLAVFDCDLVESVKTAGFAEIMPGSFFQAGVSEHSTATIAGALSINGVLAVWADFGVFAIDEVYNQLRLNDINHTNLKVIATHIGYNVGPDGKTHHCIDYLGLIRNLFGFKMIIPGDPNQTDHVVRHVLAQNGNFVIGISRSKMPVITRDDGKVLFDRDYRFAYGKYDLVRRGADCAILTYGPMLSLALEAHAALKAKGITCSIYNVPCPLDIDDAALNEAARTRLIVTYEDHNVATGLGSVVAQKMAGSRIATRFMPVGISRYGASDEAGALYRKGGLDAGSLAEMILRNL